MTGSFPNSLDTHLPFHFRNYPSHPYDLGTGPDGLHVTAPEAPPTTPVANSFPIDSVLGPTSFTPQVYFPTDLSFEGQFLGAIDTLSLPGCNINEAPLQYLNPSSDTSPRLQSTLTPGFNLFVSSLPVAVQALASSVELNQNGADCFTPSTGLELLDGQVNAQVSPATSSDSLAFSSLTESTFLLPWSFDTPPESEVPFSTSLLVSSEENRADSTETRRTEFTPYILSNPIPEYSEYSNVTFTAPTKLLDNSQLVYPCTHPNCKKTFTSLTTLNSHYRIHSPERPFRCHLCYKYFNTAHDLRRHLKTHMDLKPYRCNKCSRSFGRLDAMKRHRSNCRYAIPKVTEEVEETA